MSGTVGMVAALVSKTAGAWLPFWLSALDKISKCRGPYKI
jgi:hypothetical protein